MFNYIITFILMATIWVLFSGKFDLFHLSLGLVSCLVVTITSTRLIFGQTKVRLYDFLLTAWRFSSYCLWLLREIIKANFHVVSLSLTLRPVEEVIDPHIFTFRTQLDNELAKFILANSITLTPGTVTIRVHKNIFYIHALDSHTADDLTDQENISEMERRVAKIFKGQGKDD